MANSNSPTNGASPALDLMALIGGAMGANPAEIEMARRMGAPTMRRLPALDMQAEFLDLVKAARHDKITLKDCVVNHRSHMRDIFADHTIDYGEAIPVTLHSMAEHKPLPDIDQMPFPAFWMLYRTPNEIETPFGKIKGFIVNALHIQTAVDPNDYFFSFFLRHDMPGMTRHWTQLPTIGVRDGEFHASIPEEEMRPGFPTASMEYIPEFLHGLDLLKRRELVPVDPSPEFVTANFGRAKSKARALAPLRPMIRINGVVRERDASTSIPTGVEVTPHDRRGHRRILRSGRVINVRPCKIKGGSTRPQTYQVQA